MIISNIRASIRMTFPILLISVSVLTGCDDNVEKPATQVVAKVGSEEISIHQLNRVLQHVQPGAQQDVAVLRREALDKLIDQELAVHQAKEMKLDRSPDMVLALDLARRDVLAQAYRNEIIRSLPMPTEDEARKYYVDHPELFSDRRIYTLDEIQVPLAGSELVAQLRDMASGRRPLDEMRAFLKKRDALFSFSRTMRPAEQIPLDILSSLHKMKEGDISVVDIPGALLIQQVAVSYLEPVDQRTAIPIIRQFLSNQRAMDVIRRDAVQLRSSANIEYVGEFSPASKAEPGMTGITK